LTAPYVALIDFAMHHSDIFSPYGLGRRMGQMIFHGCLRP
jgi:hypothetical protein